MHTNDRDLWQAHSPLGAPNPFANFGTTELGERFIGRRHALSVIDSRAIRGHSNLAIIGAPRIGKSCLVQRALFDRRDELLTIRVLPVRISLGLYEEPSAFFRSVVDGCWRELTTIGWTSAQLVRAAEDALQVGLPWELLYGRMLTFFEAVRVAQVRVILVLEEFDHASRLFHGSYTHLQGIRELSQDPKWSLSCVTLSRRNITSIEVQTAAGSLLGLTFLDHYLQVFDTSEMDHHFTLLVAAGVPDSGVLREKIGFYAGGHPLLTDILSFYLVEEVRRSQGADVDLAAHRAGRAFHDYYSLLDRILEEDGLRDKLLQILFGPVIDVNQTHIDQLLRYGLLILRGDGYHAFSGHFQAYLKHDARTADLWPLWRDTERGLRRLIQSVLEQKNGAGWFDQLERDHPKLVYDPRTNTTMFERCRDGLARAARQWAEWTPTSVLDLAQPRELFEIIVQEWPAFRPVLGHDARYWRARGDFLSSVRNPLAHNNVERLHPDQRTTAEGYCKEVLRILDGADLS